MIKKKLIVTRVTKEDTTKTTNVMQTYLSIKS